MELTWQNLVYFFGRLAPMFLPCFFVFVSVLNQDWRGVLYLAGVLLACVLAIITSNTTAQLFEVDTPGASAYCQMGDTRYSHYPLSSVVLGFTAVYLFVPMIRLVGSVNNPFLIVALAGFVAVDVLFLLRNRCAYMGFLSYPLGAVLPIVLAYGIGGLVAFFISALALANENGDLLFMGGGAGGPLCKLKTRQKMRCSVYRNGALVTSQSA